jgi:small subunit ribosomal protein S17
MAVENKIVRTMTGKVLSAKMDKTIVVGVERFVKHPRFGKFIRKSTKVHAHDAENKCKEGDIVVVSESRPFSKTKKWVLDSIRESQE